MYSTKVFLTGFLFGWFLFGFLFVCLFFFFVLLCFLFVFCLFFVCFCISSSFFLGGGCFFVFVFLFSFFFCRDYVSGIYSFSHEDEIQHKGNSQTYEKTQTSTFSHRLNCSIPYCLRRQAVHSKS